MLVWDDKRQEYDAAATPSYGQDTLEAFFSKALNEGLAGQVGRIVFLCTLVRLCLLFIANEACTSCKLDSNNNHKHRYPAERCFRRQLTATICTRQELGDQAVF